MTHLAALALRPQNFFGPRQKIYAHHWTTLYFHTEPKDNTNLNAVEYCKCSVM